LHTVSSLDGSPVADDGAAAIAVHLEAVTVKYVVPVERITSFKEYAIRTIQRRIEHNEFWALRGVSLDIQRGETFGIVGRNGAGKSTLLKVVARVLRPTSGRVVVRGQVSPLLELGAGFHAELTGRENVYLSGTLLGMSRGEISRRFPEIVDFAEIGDFIDAPLRTYSTGMVVRLGFAVATAQQPDILLVDEVLAVGDISFQQKCMARMEQFRRAGSTVIIIAHSPALIEEHCRRAAWLDDGQLRALGASAEVMQQYIDAMAVD
jgi:ABC-type polysaccharide/polyol phosphate transport system ATPase subunit